MKVTVTVECPGCHERVEFETETDGLVSTGDPIQVGVSVGSHADCGYDSEAEK